MKVDIPCNRCGKILNIDTGFNYNGGFICHDCVNKSMGDISQRFYLHLHKNGSVAISRHNYKLFEGDLVYELIESTDGFTYLTQLPIEVKI